MIYTFFMRIGNRPYEVRELNLDSDEVAVAAGPDVVQAALDKLPPTEPAQQSAAVGVARGGMLSDDELLGEWSWTVQDGHWEWRASQTGL